MRVEIVRRDERKFQVRLPSGESFIMDKEEIPSQLRSWGMEFMNISLFKKGGSISSRDIVNYLLCEEYVQ